MSGSCSLILVALKLTAVNVILVALDVRLPLLREIIQRENCDAAECQFYSSHRERGLEDLATQISRKTHDIVCVTPSDRMSRPGASPREQSRHTACESRRGAFRR